MVTKQKMSIPLDENTSVALKKMMDEPEMIFQGIDTPAVQQDFKPLEPQPAMANPVSYNEVPEVKIKSKDRIPYAKKNHPIVFRATEEEKALFERVIENTKYKSIQHFFEGEILTLLRKMDQGIH